MNASVRATPDSAESSSSPDFRKSSYCSNDSCVEMAFVGGEVLVRDGKARQAPLLHFSGGAWSAFLGGVTAGEFDSEA